MTNFTRPRHRFLVLAAVVASLFLTGCGGSSVPEPPVPGNGSSGGGAGGTTIPLHDPLPGILAARVSEWQDTNGLLPPSMNMAGLADRDARIRMAETELIGTDLMVLDQGAYWQPGTVSDYPFPDDDSDKAYTLLGDRAGVMLGWRSSHSTITPGYTTRLVLQWGGWLETSRFGVVVSDGLHEEHGVRFNVLFAFSDGMTSAGLQEGGIATYRGLAVARAVAGLMSEDSLTLHSLPRPSGLLLGDVDIDVNFGRSLVNVRFTGFYDLDFGDTRTEPDISWTDVPLSRSRFFSTGEGRYLSGALFGQNGAEIGGVFRTGALLGAFGASRFAGQVRENPVNLSAPAANPR